MAQIIITVSDKLSGTEYDVEVPNDLECEKLLDDIIQALTGANPQLHWDLYTSVLESPKLKKALNPRKTLSEEGIWNGDFLYIMEC